MKSKTNGNTSKPSAEIDGLFKQLKTKKEDKKRRLLQEEKEQQEIDAKKKRLEKEMKKVLEKAEAAKRQQNPQPKLVRYDTDGMPIYTEDSLRINAGDSGDTADCPFDCWCCF